MPAAEMVDCIIHRVDQRAQIEDRRAICRSDPGYVNASLSRVIRNSTYPGKGKFKIILKRQNQYILATWESGRGVVKWQDPWQDRFVTSRGCNLLPEYGKLCPRGIMVISVYNMFAESENTKGIMPY